VTSPASASDPPARRCRRCGVLTAAHDFPIVTSARYLKSVRRWRGRTGRRRDCRACYNAAQRERCRAWRRRQKIITRDGRFT
jgi:hypothetical protein